MIDDVVEITQLAEDVGFEAVCFPEHHLHSEGIEMGSLPVLTQHVIHNTKRIKVGPDRLCAARMESAAAGARNRVAGSTDERAHVCRIRARLSRRAGSTRWRRRFTSAPPPATRARPISVNREAFEEVYQFPEAGVGRRAVPLQGQILRVSRIRRKERRGRRMNGRGNTAFPAKLTSKAGSR